MMYSRGFGGFGGCFGGYGPGFSGPWIMMGIGVLLLTAVIISAVVLFQRTASRKKEDSKALDLLEIRYAKGEMSEEEYLKMKKVLSK